MSEVPKCQDCGACCDFYSEVFVHHRDENIDWLIGQNLVEPYPLGGYLMRQRDDCCIAFEGEIGVTARCTIYEHRPETCQDFEAGGERCRNVRFITITRRGRPIFVPNDPSTWPTKELKS